MHTDEIYWKYKIPKFDQILKIENVKLWHKQQSNQLPTRLQTIMTEDHTHSTLNREHKYLTRNKNIPKLPLAKSSQYQNSLFIKGTKQVPKTSTWTEKNNQLQLLC